MLSWGWGGAWVLLLALTFALPSSSDGIRSRVKAFQAPALSSAQLPASTEVRGSAGYFPHPDSASSSSTPSQSSKPASEAATTSSSSAPVVASSSATAPPPTAVSDDGDEETDGNPPSQNKKKKKSRSRMYVLNNVNGMHARETNLPNAYNREMLRWSERQLKTEQKLKDEALAKRAGEGAIKSEQKQKLDQIIDVANHNEAREKYEQHTKNIYQMRAGSLAQRMSAETQQLLTQQTNLAEEHKVLQDHLMYTNAQRWLPIEQAENERSKQFPQEQLAKRSLSEQQAKISLRATQSQAEEAVQAAQQRARGLNPFTLRD